MTGDALQTYLAALASSLTIGVLVPLLILGLAVWLVWVLIARAQRDPGFNIADVLRDEHGKVSSERLLMFASWAASTWVLSVVVFAIPANVVEAYAIYLGVWGGVGAVKHFANRKYGTEPERAP